MLIIGLSISATTHADSPAVTVYNQDFAVVREDVPLDLKTGVNRVAFSEISAHAEPDSVLLRDPTGQTQLRILEQNYRADPVSQLMLLSQYEGQTIDFVIGSGESQQIVKGKIVRSGYVPQHSAMSRFGQAYYQRQAARSYNTANQPLIEIDGQLRFGLPGTPVFPKLTSDSILKPTLHWQILSDKTESVTAELAYITGGMTWKADYNVVAEPEGDDVSILGWITVENQCGRTFENARIKLMAGDVSRVAPLDGFSMAGEFRAMSRLGFAGNGPAVSEKAFEDYHLYTIARPSTLRDRETKQIEFIRADGVATKRKYVYDGAQFDWNQYRGWNLQSLRSHDGFGAHGTKKVSIVREFLNSEKNNLGMPLPAGKVRFYRRDDDGQLEFTGENMIDHTPRDETVRVSTGSAFDLVGERIRTDFKTDHGKNFTDESFEIKLRNRKEEAVNITIVEHFYRWYTWEIQDNNHPFTKKNSNTIEFEVVLEPGEEKTINYKVHYSW